MLVRPDRSLVSTLIYNNQTPEVFIRELTKLLRETGMLKEYSRNEKLMGSAFQLIVTANNAATGTELLNSCVDGVRRIEELLTTFKETSQTSLINRNAGKDFVDVDEEVYQLIERSIHLSKLSGGAFDISSGVLKKLYRFQGEQFSLPSPAAISNHFRKQDIKRYGYLHRTKCYCQSKECRSGLALSGKAMPLIRSKAC